MSQTPNNLSPVKRALLALEEMQSRLDAVERSRKEPIAIIGLGCRFPGESNTPDEFWRLVASGRDAVTEIPRERWDVDAYYDPNPEALGKMSTRWGGFLKHVDMFDCGFFGISPREAISMDPQQRLFMEVSWEALEDAGLTLEKLAGSRTAVFAGVSGMDYAFFQLTEPFGLDRYLGSGTPHSILPGRLSYFLDLRGPSIPLDTACSSSLVAVHLACQSLRANETDLAIVGGVNLLLSPHTTISVSKMRMMAADGRCKTFDARADGFVRGEGCGVVVLKRLSAALADGDPILALVCGSAVNQDGRTTGLTAPNVLAQQTVIREALQSSGIAPEQVTYIESHGTGTPLGDPIEIEALAKVYAKPRVDGQRCAIGAVKTNIGHLEAAAGMAGLIKTVLALRHELIPPNLHFRQLNPNISLRDTRFVIPTEALPWPHGAEARCAGVSSFGMSGTNAHLIVSEAPPPPPRARVPAGDSPWLLPLSARSPGALRDLARRYHEVLLNTAPDALPDLVFSACRRRSQHAERLALVGRAPHDLAAALDAFLHDQPAAALVDGTLPATGRPRLVFVCPGQGAQWPGMARELLAHEPAFAAELAACDLALRPYLGWSLRDALAADPPAPQLSQIDGIQPALFAITLALAALWRHYGVVPDALVGHSMGEVAAAVLAGVLSREAAAQLICLRSRLLRRISGQGAMALVELPVEEAQAALAPCAGQLSVAVSNSPRATVIAGAPDALDTLLAELERQQIFCRRVQVDVAAHSPQVAPLQAELVRGLAELRPQRGNLPLYSTVSGAPIAGTACDAAYWGRNLREPVRFAAAVEQLVRDGYSVFVELSPHPLLLPALAESVPEEGLLLPSLRREEDGRAVLRAGLGQLWVRGYPLNWGALAPAEGRCVRLPGYPWQRERFWVEQGSDQTLAARQPGAGGHPLLGLYVSSATPRGLHLWESDLTSGSVPYLAEHQVQGLVVLPAAAYAELGLAAGRHLGGASTPVLEELRLAQPLALSETPVRMQVTLREDGCGTAAFQVASRPVEADRDAAWTVHATAAIRFVTGEPQEAAPQLPARAEIIARCAEETNGPALYTMLQQRGYNYGPTFRGIAQIWQCADEAIARLEPPGAVRETSDRYQIHPALLDSCLQVFGAVLAGTAPFPSRDTVTLPVALERLQLYERPAGPLWCYARARTGSSSNGQSDTAVGDLYLLSDDGRVMLEASGLSLQRADSLNQPAANVAGDWLYTTKWQPSDPLPAPAARAAGLWLLFADQRGMAEALAEHLLAHDAQVIRVVPGSGFRRLDERTYQIDPATPNDLQLLLGALSAEDYPPCRGIVHLWGLDLALPDPNAESLDAAIDRGCICILHLVQALAQAGWPSTPRLWHVSAGARALRPDEEVAVAQAPLWGFMRVLALEHPELHCACIDLTPAAGPEASAGIFAELWADTHEEEVAWRGGQRYVARLARYDLDADAPTTRAIAGQHPFRLEHGGQGQPERPILRASPRPAPGPGEVEIAVSMAGLNARDAGSFPHDGRAAADGPCAFGMECAGVITAVGAGVAGLNVGDPVIGLAPGAASSFVVADARFVFRKPANLNYGGAASTPLAFLTASYALHHLARLRCGERMLICDATSDIGLAAVQLAQRAGAEIIATADTPDKRDYLRLLGIEHVFDARAGDLPEQIKRLSAGRGVDIVLNMLTDAPISRSIACLAPCGRFVEFGASRRDNLVDLHLFQKGLSFFQVDLETLVAAQPDTCHELLSTIVQQLAAGALQPLPHQIIPIGEAARALGALADEQPIGKLILELYGHEVPVAPAGGPLRCRADATYLISGGLGGLGLLLAQWLAQRGARHLALLGRHAPGPAALSVLGKLAAQGVEVRAFAADVTQPAALAGVLTAIAADAPPLRGVFHAAGVPDDDILLRLNRARFAQVLGPKVHGAWHLHTQTRHLPLDYFVLFSSAASLLGSPGQGGHAAADAFLDALAHARRAQGLPALSINWGPWAEVGQAARADRTRQLELSGLSALSNAQGLAILGRLVAQPAAQVCVLPFTIQQWCALYPKARDSLLLAQIARETAGTAPGANSAGIAGQTRLAILAAGAGEGRRLTETYLADQVGRALGFARSKVNTKRPLTELGLDSLVAVKLKNTIETELDVDIPVTTFFQGVTIDQLADYIRSQLPGVDNGDGAGAHRQPDCR